jgi:hypothetical protein
MATQSPRDRDAADSQPSRDEVLKRMLKMKPDDASKAPLGKKTIRKGQSKSKRA